VAPVVVMAKATEAEEDSRRVIPVAIAVVAVAVAAPPPSVAVPAAPMDGIDLAGTIFPDAA
jgi:hypothetical protein